MTARDATTEDATTPSDPADEAGSPGDAAATDAVDPVEPGDTDVAEPAEAEAAGSDDDAAAPAEPKRARRHRGSAGRTRSARRWPWVALVLVAALFAAAMVVLFVVTRPDPVPGLTSAQQAAVDAAAQEAVNLQTYRRASFDQDFANALAGATSDYATQQIAPRKDTLLKALTDGKRDATATALSSGLEASTDTSATVLVVTQAAQTADNGQSTPFVFSRLRITMQLVKGTWLLSDLSSVGLS